MDVTSDFSTNFAIARIRLHSESSKPMENQQGGSYYFVCERKDCQFFKWCEPINEDDVVTSSMPLPETERESFSLILSSIEENNRAIEKLRSVLMYGFCFFVVVLFGRFRRCVK